MRMQQNGFSHFSLHSGLWVKVTSECLSPVYLIYVYKTTTKDNIITITKTNIEKIKYKNIKLYT